jgi:ferric-dicitrate binding protein FerR (iron transport regulator)
MTTAERVSREANERLKSLGDEAAGMAGRLGEWVAERSHQLAEAAPDGRTIRNEAEGLVGAVGAWLKDLPETLERAMPVRVERRTRWSAVFAAAALGAILAYLFDSASGSDRRARLKARLTGGMADANGDQSRNNSSQNATSTPSLSTPGFERQPV